jgi:membrane-associated phospholipid phosphatase
VLLIEAFRVLADFRKLMVSAIVLAGLTLFGLSFWDVPLMEYFSSNQTAEMARFAQHVSFWGDIHTGWLIIAGLLGLAGFVFRQRRWRQAALACMLASALAGLATYPLKAGLGRSRPCAPVEPGLYGPAINYDLNSFPSGHAATAFGWGSALAVALPLLGLPALVLAGGSAWSRLYLLRHWPTDMLAGGFLGFLAGVPLGWAVRRRKASESDVESHGLE